MVRDRISEDIYLFSSTRYAQVSAGAVLSPEGAALIDTLAFPTETLEIRHFIEHKMGCKVRWVINTHHHADHTMGNYLFPEAEIIAHQLCRELLDTRGRQGLEAAKGHTPELEGVAIVLPTLAFSKVTVASPPVCAGPKCASAIVSPPTCSLHAVSKSVSA